MSQYLLNIASLQSDLYTRCQAGELVTIVKQAGAGGAANAATSKARTSMRTNSRALFAACSLSVAACSAFAAAPVYDVSCMDCTAGRLLKPLGINNAGVVIATDNASCYFPGGCAAGQGYILDHGSIMPTPSFDTGNLGSSVQAVNNSNAVVGRASFSQGLRGPFGYSWDGNSMVNLGDGINDYGDGYWSAAADINDGVHVAGTAAGGYHDAEAFIFKNGLMTEVTPPVLVYGPD